MIEKINDEELEFMEGLYNPVCFIESAFSDFDNLIFCDEEEYGHIRTGQLPLLSYEYLIDKDPKLSDKENFKLREGAGTVYVLGGRKFGKTLCVEINANILENGGKLIFCLIRDISERKTIDSKKYIEDQKQKDRIKQDIAELRQKIKKVHFKTIGDKGEIT